MILFLVDCYVTMSRKTEVNQGVNPGVNPGNLELCQQQLPFYEHEQVWVLELVMEEHVYIKCDVDAPIQPHMRILETCIRTTMRGALVKFIIRPHWFELLELVSLPNFMIVLKTREEWPDCHRFATSVLRVPKQVVIKDLNHNRFKTSGPIEHLRIPILPYTEGNLDDMMFVSVRRSILEHFQKIASGRLHSPRPFVDLHAVDMGSYLASAGIPQPESSFGAVLARVGLQEPQFWEAVLTHTHSQQRQQHSREHSHTHKWRPYQVRRDAMPQPFKKRRTG